MVTNQKPFTSLSAADLMSRDLVLVPHEMSLRGAAHLLSQGRVSGAPVVDTEGHCVGVLSSTDFLLWAAHEESDHLRKPERPPCYYSSWQVAEPDSLPVEKVSRFMTADPVMVPPSTRIRELAGMMLDAHVHRVVVVDEHERPVGIVSSMDVLAAVAQMEPSPTPADVRTALSAY
jgi:CBS-domain-containing membrane protein